MTSDLTWQQRAEQAELGLFRLQLTIRFLVDEVREYVAYEQRHGLNDRLRGLLQFAGVADGVVRDDQPWTAVEMRIALLEERIWELEGGRLETTDVL